MVKTKKTIKFCRSHHISLTFTFTKDLETQCSSQILFVVLISRMFFLLETEISVFEYDRVPLKNCIIKAGKHNSQAIGLSVKCHTNPQQPKSPIQKVFSF